jgi:hypothetical protein
MRILVLAGKWYSAIPEITSGVTELAVTIFAQHHTIFRSANPRVLSRVGGRRLVWHHMMTMREIILQICLAPGAQPTLPEHSFHSGRWGKFKQSRHIQLCVCLNRVMFRGIKQQGQSELCEL